MTEHDYRLQWDDDWQPPPDQREAIEAAVRADLARNRCTPNNIIFHHVMLTERGSDGPLVFVYSPDYEPVFRCKYDENPVWKTLTELREAKAAGLSADDESGTHRSVSGGQQ